MLPLRTPKHCRDRYHYVLNPELNHDKWTAEEDMKIVKLHNALGNRWAVIAKNLQNRTDLQVKNRFNNVLRKNLFD